VTRSDENETILKLLDLLRWSDEKVGIGDYGENNSTEESIAPFVVMFQKSFYSHRRKPSYALVRLPHIPTKLMRMCTSSTTPQNSIHMRFKPCVLDVAVTSAIQEHVVHSGRSSSLTTWISPTRAWLLRVYRTEYASAGKGSGRPNLL
jgi:hypothetical protein